ncbi:MAG TPA: response regulator [Bacteroidales bacterium]|nr:response regulator [Bacteroidales bacterium]
MNPETHRIIIIDDDETVRRSIYLLLSSSGYLAETFSGAGEFLNSGPYPGPGCILLDIFLEGDSGLEVQEEITSGFPTLPIIYMTGFGDVPMSVQALKKGAINFLQKPFLDEQLLEAVEEALRKSRELIANETETRHLSALLESLSPREYEIFQLVVRGLLNKQIAAELFISEHTVKIHRGNITKKLGMKSVAQMVQLHEKLSRR